MSESTNETKEKEIDDLDFMKDIEDDAETNEEEEKNGNEVSQKNKDAEEARKRREEEKKSDKSDTADKKGEDKKNSTEDVNKANETSEDDKKKAEAEKKQKTNEKKVYDQLKDFKDKYPDISLETLDNDKQFKKFISGRMLGKETFIELYEDFITLKGEVSGKTSEEITNDYALKKNASSGSSKGNANASGSGTPSNIYSETEMEDLTEKLPFMQPGTKEYEATMKKFKESIAYYDKKK